MDIEFRSYWRWCCRYIPIGAHYGNKFRSKYTLSGSYIPLKNDSGPGGSKTKNKRKGTPKAIRKAARRARKVSRNSK